MAGAAVVAGLISRELTADHSVDRVRSALRVPRPARPAPPLPPGTDFRIPGLSPFVTPNGKFYRVDEALVLPQVPPSAWNLRIHGMVQKEIRIGFRDLLKRPLIEDWITLCCVSNPVGGPYIGNAKWLGASLASLLREAGIRAGADQIVATSVDGFTSGTPIQAVMDGRDALLAIAMNGSPLPVEHGFPVRMVVPGLYGYVSACIRNFPIRTHRFQRVKQNNLFVKGTPSAEFHSSIAQPGELIVYKQRVGAFSENQLHLILRSRGVENLVLLRNFDERHHSFDAKTSIRPGFQVRRPQGRLFRRR